MGSKKQILWNFYPKCLITPKILRWPQNAATLLLGLILSLAAIVSETSTDVVQKALETVKTNMISDWFKKTIGKSVQPQRVAVNRSLKEEEQKWEQFCAE